MKKFSIKAVAVAVGVICAGVAHAGSITAPANPVKYAVEAMTATTSVNLPAVIYAMGVGRPIGNGFTVIVNPTGGLFTGTCPSLTYGVGGASTVGITLKRQSAGECAYDVTVASAPVAVNDTFEFAAGALVTNSHTLNTVGGNFGVTFTLKDPSENSFVDQTGSQAKTLATGIQAVNVYAATSDTATIADVNATGGPLTGFVPVAAAAPRPAIVAGRTAAVLTFDNNTQGALNPNGTVYSITGGGGSCPAGGGGTVTLVLNGTLTGAATNGIFADLNANSSQNAGEQFTIAGTTATLANVLAASAFPQPSCGAGAPGLVTAGAASTVPVYFAADGTTQLGTTRTISISGTVTPTVGTANAFLNTQTAASPQVAAFNSNWWVWSANASQLVAPYFTTNTAVFLTRFFFTNTSALPVGYSATCYSESGNTVIYGPKRTGTLSAGGVTAVNGQEICTFADTGLPRGSVLFTINAPITNIQGAYQAIDPATRNGVVVPMRRPFSTSTTE